MVVEEQAGCARRDPRRLSGSNGAPIPTTGGWREVSHGPLSRVATSVPIEGPVSHLLPRARWKDCRRRPDKLRVTVLAEAVPV